MGFNQNLLEIKKEIDGFTNSPSILMPKFIKRKLDRSLDNYLKELEININYLLYRDRNKVQKYLDKTILKEIKNE